LRKFFDYLNHVAVSKMYCATSSWCDLIKLNRWMEIHRHEWC
jgi:hypothetical protein